MSFNFIAVNLNNLMPDEFAEETFSNAVLEELTEMFENVREFEENRLEDYQEVLRWNLRENRTITTVFFNIRNRFERVMTDIKQFYYRGDNDSIRDIVRVLNRRGEDSDSDREIPDLYPELPELPDPIYNPNDYGHCALCA